MGFSRPHKGGGYGRALGWPRTLGCRATHKSRPGALLRRLAQASHRKQDFEGALKILFKDNGPVFCAVSIVGGFLPLCEQCRNMG